MLVAAAALFAATSVFLAIVPAAIQDRYLAPALPPMLILAADALHSGLRVLAPLMSPGWRRAAAVLALVVIGLTALPSAFDPVPPRRFEMAEAVQQVWRYRIPANPSVLIAVAAAGEGAAVAELALTDAARPALFAIRGSRLLGAGGYNTTDYQPRFATAAEAMAAIDDYAIPFVLLQASSQGNAWRHLDQLAAARAAAPERWELLWRGDRSGVPLELFAIRGNETRQADRRRLLALSAPRALAAGD
jgi:hypothetical protein